MVKNRLEEIFDYSYQVLWKELYFLVRETDFPLYLIVKTKTRFKPHQMVDRILLNFDHNLAFELKYTKNKAIALSRISPHQIKFLLEFENKCGKGFFLFGFQELESIFLIPIKSFLNFRDTLKKKSFNIHDLEKLIEKQLGFKIGLCKLKRRKKYCLDIPEIISFSS